MKIDIFDFKYAEPIYWYMEKWLDEFSEYLEDHEDLSLAEYVYEFHYDDFVEWCSAYYPNL